MNNAMTVFNSLIAQCSTTLGIYEYLESNTIPIDASDLLRWQYVLAVSALDKYIHDIVRIGMVEEFKGNRVVTDSFKGIKLKSNNCNKECQITFAKYQGRKEITSHLLNSSGEGKKPFLFTINKSKLRIRLPRKYAEEIKINRRDIINIIEFYDI